MGHKSGEVTSEDGSDILHRSNHRRLITRIGNVEPREIGGPTAYANMHVYGTKRDGQYVHVYAATGRLAAVVFELDTDHECWWYHSFSVSNEQAACELLRGGDINDRSLAVKRNTLHTKVNPERDMGLVADLGAAAVFVISAADIGQTALPHIQFAGTTKAAGPPPIRSRLFVPEGNGMPVAVATTHLRDDTTSMMAFRVPSMDAADMLLRRGDVAPGESCPPLPEFIDFSMFRSEPSSEAFIGRLLARSLCDFDE